MNLTKYSFENPKIIYFFLALLLVGGVLSFQSLGKKEDAPFVIKTVVLVTQYPGATPEEVEELITEPIEREVQSLRRVTKIKSESYYGVSKITVELFAGTPAEEIPQMWDELRRKVLNIQSQLPEGASTIQVNDDFGDVYGIYFALRIGEGYSYSEAREWANYIKTEIVPLDGVEKVQIFGEQQEVVNVKISMANLSDLGIDYQSVMSILSTQNTLVNTGVKKAGEVELRIQANSLFTSLDDIRQQVITGSTGERFTINDIAEVERAYSDPPRTLMRVNGLPALGIGIATASDKDVVATGDLVREQLDRIMGQIPAGLELIALYPEDQIAREANNGFIINLLQSVAIVIFILTLVMGFRASSIIGTSLIFAISGTLLVMDSLGISLNRTSLAGFIIAMGMLVDNAIVVTDNAQVALKQGIKKKKAIMDGAVNPQWGLFGATLIAIASFLPLYLAPAAVAEMVSPLFVVIGISLGLSWVLALTQTPLFEMKLLKEKDGEGKDPYGSGFYVSFGKILLKFVKYKWITLVAVMGLFFLSLFVMGIMPQNFFPSLDKPYFRADVFLADGQSIYETEENIISIEEYLMEQPSVRNVSITMGSSPLRYYLASTSFGPKGNFANILVELHSSDSTKVVEQRFDQYIRDNYPKLLVRSSLFKLSPAVEAVIEVGFIGSNKDTLIHLAEEAKAILRANDKLESFRTSWGNQVPVWKANYDENSGIRLGFGRTTLANTLRMGTNGIPLGTFKEGDKNIPILLKNPDEDMPVSGFRSMPLIGPGGPQVPLEQVVDSFELVYEYPVIKRYNRQRYIMAQADPKRGANANAAFAEVKEAIDNHMKIPDGYKLKYFGEAESQEESNSALASKMPLTFFLIIITLLFLFRNYRQPVIIFLMLPLIFIGVVIGLLTLGKMFDFFALLGLLGLIGMNIKNSIVLIDQINIEMKSGKEPVGSIIDATKSRIVPVIMASGTTILGMLPLLFDSMFGGMAATIMGGLFMASILTLFVLPVTFAAFYKIKVK